MDHTSEFTAAAHGPGEDPDAYGFDEPKGKRPGVPMEAEPHPAAGAHWQEPARQHSDVTHLHRKGLQQLTPVYGTAQPPRGLSGVMRRVAYRIPEHEARHWALLIAADRVDVLEGRLGEALGSRLDDAGLGGVAERVEKNPLLLLFGLAASGYVASRVLR